MSLSNIKKMKDEQGFTIVELLIVIVIIAILAAIVFVAYANITGRANDSAYKSDAASIAKTFEAINADTGSYPTAISSNNVSGTAATLPANVRITGANNAPQLNQKGSATCSTNPQTLAAASQWPVCEENGVKYYVVRNMSSTGACVYYPQTTGTGAGVKSQTIGSPATAC